MSTQRADPAVRGGWPSLAFVAAGAVATGLYVMDVAATVAFAFVGLGTCVALFVGPRRLRVRPRRPWTMIGYAAVFFTVGAVLRPFVADAPGAAVLLADAFTVPGYLVMIGGLASLLSARRGIDRNALIDGLIVCAGTAIASTLLLALPAATIEGRPLAVSVLAGVYPLFDVVLVLLVVNLAFTTAVRRPSFVLLVGSVMFMLVGDVAYAVIGTAGELYGSPMLDLPFLLAFTLMGAAALHPSAANVVQATPLPVQAWSWQRLLVIGPALAVPFVLTAVLDEKHTVQRVVLGAGGALLVTLLLLRAVTAVQSYAVAQRRYRHQATHDPLTGLPNRRMLATAVDQMCAPGPRPAGESLIWMYFLDLDGFKFVNDSWGHPAGDQLIVDVGRRLRAELPERATVARVGGDEFVVVERCSPPDAMLRAQQIMGCLHAPLRIETCKGAGSLDASRPRPGTFAEVVIGASMGIASADPATDAAVTAEALMRDADIALYRTKAERRGGWTVFDATMHQRVRERAELEVALRAAVNQERLHLAYQPIVDLPTGRVEAAEALLRWEHPERGPIGPNVFIPIAEESNIIGPLGSWVLREAVRQLGAWRADGSVTGDFWMSINISPRQLTDPGLAGLVADELARARVPACRIVLEITESVMIEGNETTDRVLEELRALGVRLSVDDFGTGFSALGYLRRHPVTGVKVDRSFVSGLGANAEDEEIVRAVVAMSAALRLSVVAEGVETPEQRDVLAALGVSCGQGWLWGHAVPPAEFVGQWARPAPVSAWWG